MSILMTKQSTSLSTADNLHYLVMTVHGQRKTAVFVHTLWRRYVKTVKLKRSLFATRMFHRYEYAESKIFAGQVNKTTRQKSEDRCIYLFLVFIQFFSKNFLQH